MQNLQWFTEIRLAQFFGLYFQFTNSQSLCFGNQPYDPAAKSERDQGGSGDRKQAVLSTFRALLYQLYLESL